MKNFINIGILFLVILTSGLQSSKVLSKSKKQIKRQLILPQYNNYEDKDNKVIKKLIESDNKKNIVISDEESELELQKLLNFIEEKEKKNTLPKIKKKRFQDGVNGSKKYRRCWKHSEKHKKHNGRTREAIEDNKFFISPEDSAALTKLLQRETENNENGGEIFEPKRKNSKNIFIKVRNFLKNSFRSKTSTTLSTKIEDTSTEKIKEEEMLTPSVPVEFIIPFSGPHLSLTTVKVPEINQYENSTERSKDLDKLSSKSESIGGRRVTFDFKIKLIPIIYH